MVKKGLTDEQKEEQFNAWKETEEWKAMERFMEKREGVPLEISMKDICTDMQPYFDELFALMTACKVSKKAKAYEQKYIRTMYFERLEKGNVVEIDGQPHQITMQANVENFNCRQAIFEIHNLFEEGRMQMEVTPDNYTSWKKELQKAMKAWDSNYIKHQKLKIYDIMADIHTKAMQPLTDLINSNRNFTLIEKMKANTKDYSVPDFRFIALEEKFVQHMTGVCNIFRDYGNNKIEEHYDIRQMLETLKIHEWKKVVPFAFYLQPLEDALKKVREELLEMHERGPLLVKYFVEENDELRNRTEEMLKKDKKAQLLVGDELKQDQFRFFFDTCEIIFESALQTQLVNNDKRVTEEVIPMLVAYKGVMRIRDIQLRKHFESVKAKEKAERTGGPANLPSGKEEEKDPKQIGREQSNSLQHDPKQMTEEELAAKRLKDRENAADLGLTEDQLAAKEEARLRKIYGRYWVWEGYFNEKRKEQWEQTAEMLKHVNLHVLQDIEDAILLRGFGKEKPEKIKTIIESDHQLKNADSLKLIQTDVEEAAQEQKIIDEKRRFMLPLRPSEKIWNFFEDCPPEDKTKHVLRFNAKPEVAYCDGRIEEIMQNLEQIAMNLVSHNQALWDSLMRNTLVVFQHLHKKQQAQLQMADA